ncbi:hypothetical protein BAY59_09260 [Prauserella coralliicola]|nr:hypothetical protein BAY59_09260 [Prauserella coralliicola]
MGTGGRRRIHHVGRWSDDVAADSAVLAAHGCVTEASRTGSGRAPYLSFPRSTCSTRGFRIELVSRAAEPGLRRCWAAPGTGRRQEEVR